MKRRALKVATYGKTGREYYRLHERAAAQRRAVWTITVLVVFIVAVVIMVVIMVVHLSPLLR